MGGGAFKQPGSVPSSEDGLQDVRFNEASGSGVLWKSGSKEGRSQGLGAMDNSRFAFKPQDKTLMTSLRRNYRFNSTLLQTLKLRRFFFPPQVTSVETSLNFKSY